MFCLLSLPSTFPDDVLLPFHMTRFSFFYLLEGWDIADVELGNHSLKLNGRRTLLGRAKGAGAPVLSGGHSGQSISKGCASVCPNSGINIGIAAASVSCCSSSLCNISGATSVKVSYSVLAMAILASFFYIRAGL
uniref:Snake toxin/toxin-like domain-containing protein n=1 Tax=Chrysemys picta bellii TaxID=8478 RepID=A0A8C3I1A9_CHRPI